MGRAKRLVNRDAEILSLRVPTLKALWKEANLAILTNPEEYVEDCTNSYAFIRGGLFYVHSATGAGLNLGEVGYGSSKWAHLLRGYFYPPSYRGALASAKKYLGKKQRPPVGIVFMGERINKAPGISSSAGPCLLSMAFSWDYGAHTPKVMVHSRSAELTRKFYADLVFMHVIIREFGKELGFDPEKVSITWVIPRLTQAVDYIPALLLQLDRWDIIEGEEGHPWIQYIRKAVPTREDLNHKFRTRRVAVEHYYRIKDGETFQDIPPESLHLPV